MKLVLLCASYFDRLGHPIFADKIKAELISRFQGRVEIFGICAASNGYKNESVSGVIPISVLCGTRFNIDTRNALSKRYGRIASIMFWWIRLISITHFYWRIFSRLEPGTMVIDLECEPIQANFAALISSIHPEVRMGVVIHSMPVESKSILLKAYKYLSVIAIGELIGLPNRRAIFMNSSALEAAVRKGIDRERCILGGWGYDVISPNLIPIHNTNGNRTVVLAFGVLRKNKRIEQLVELFLELDDPLLTLRIVGRSIDVDISQLNRRIKDSTSRTIIEIFEGYIEEDKVVSLFTNCHMVVLSHSAIFESMSGPMFLAIQYERPILCFSGNTVASLVQESGAGIVMNLDDDLPAIRSAIVRLRKWRYYQETLGRFRWSSIARRMVDW